MVHLDREVTPAYDLEVKVSDGGGLFCMTKVKVTVRDVNDHAPEFARSVYRVSLAEDAEVGALVTRVKATDKDTGRSQGKVRGQGGGVTRVKATDKDTDRSQDRNTFC